MTRVVDTSVLYAAVSAGDVHHRRARDELAKPEAMRVPLAVLVEFLGLVGHRQGSAMATTAYRALQGLGTLDVGQSQDAEQAIHLWLASPGLSLADAVGIQEALHSGVPLLTYDAVQEKAYRALAR